jgi:general secretion pathway protein D
MIELILMSLLAASPADKAAPSQGLAQNDAPAPPSGGLPPSALRQIIRRRQQAAQSNTIKRTSPINNTEAPQPDLNAPSPITPPAQPVPVPITVPGQPAVPRAPGGLPQGTANIDLQEREKKGKFSFDFSKAELVDIVKAVSDMTRKNFIVPEKIKGQRLSILSPTKITADEAYQVFVAALAVNGISMTKVGKFYKLVDSKDAIRGTIPTCLEGEKCPEGLELMITEIMPMNYVDSGAISNVVKSLISKDGDVQIFQPSNALIISEYGPNLARIKRIVGSLDVPGFDDEMRLVQVHYTSATDLSEKLSQIFDVAGKGGGTTHKPRDPNIPQVIQPGQPAGGDDSSSEVSISKMVPDDRTNMLIIKANKRSFAAIERLISKLDVPVSDAEQGKIHVVYLANAAAEDLSSTLSSLASGQPTTKKAVPGGVVGGVPGGPQGAGGGRVESAVLFEGEIKITADKSTNSLIIVSSPHDFRAVKALIDQLDRPRSQVYVEAAILEVQVQNDNRWGVDFHAPGGNDLGGKGNFGFLQSSWSNVAGISPTLGAFTNPASLISAAGGSVAGIFGKSASFDVGGTAITVPSFGLILRWLQTSASTNVLSTPHLLTTDNEEATIEVGQKIPFQRGTALPALATPGALTGAAGSAAGLGGALGGLGGNLFASTDRIDVKLQLTLTPHINEHNKVRLDIKQEIEDVAPDQPQSGTPTTSHRSVKTVVTLDDQQTVILGGLMRDNKTESEAKFPILGDIPILGWLFKNRSKKDIKQNLLLVLTPYIIRSSDDFQRIFQRKMNEYEEFSAEFYGELPEYRAHIDYSKKAGPFAAIVGLENEELNKIENGGPGTNQMLIGPGKPPEEQPKPQNAAPEPPPLMHLAPETEAQPQPKPEIVPELKPETPPPVQDERPQPESPEEQSPLPKAPEIAPNENPEHPSIP